MLPQARAGIRVALEAHAFGRVLGYSRPMCDALVAIGRNTRDGTTLFAQNSDRSVAEPQSLVQFPAAYHPLGARVECTHIAIPQVAETYRVMGHAPDWVWGFEQGVNEHAVAIGKQRVSTKQPVEEQIGLVGMDLVRLGLERGRDAREALEVIATLIEQHGQGGPDRDPDDAGSSNAFLLADPDQAWQMETSGRCWAARRVDLAAQSNHLTLSSNWSIGSRDLESVARLQGWWSGPDRLDMSSAYRLPDAADAGSDARHTRSCDLLNSGRGKHDCASFIEALRDHGREGQGPTIKGEQGSLCVHDELMVTTAASLVVALPSDRSRPWATWASFGVPCLGLFLPVYLEGVIPASLAAPMTSHSVWGAFMALREAMEADGWQSWPVVRSRFDQWSERLEEQRTRIEREASTLKESEEDVEAAAILSAFMKTTADQAFEMAVSETERIRL